MHNPLDEIMQRIVTVFGGPGHLRLVLQPLVALLLGFRDGRLDAAAGTPPFLWRLIFEPDQRRTVARSAIGSLLKPLVVAIVMDGILQFMVLRSIDLVQAVVVGALLVALPYTLVRGVANRMKVAATSRHDRHEVH